MDILTAENTMKMLEFVGIQLRTVSVSINMVVWDLYYTPTFENYSAAVQAIIDKMGTDYTYDHVRELDILYETSKYQNNFLLLDFDDKSAYLYRKNRS